MKLYNRFTQLSFLLIIASATLISCKKKKDEEQTPVIVNPPVVLPLPNVYQADVANYAEATVNLEMFHELIEATEEGNTVGTEVSESKLNNMLNNISNPFTGDLTKNSTSKLADIINPNVKADLATYFKDLATSSLAKTNGDSLKAGVILGIGATSGKLYDAAGFANYELIEKGLMGALQLYQITAVQLADSSLAASVNNTKRLKKWDLAFGYLGVPKDFTVPYATTYPFWGEYFKTNDETLGGCVNKIMTAFVNGRKAIENNTNDLVKTNADIIKVEMDKVAAGMALTYLFRARKFSLNGDKGRRNGTASEGLGFLNALKYHASRKITNSELDIVIGLVGKNNWTLKIVDIEAAIVALATPYGFDANPATSKFNK